MVSPSWVALWSEAGETVPVLAMLTDGAGTTVGTLMADGALTGLVTPALVVPVAVAVSLTEPWSTSACVTVYVVVPVHLIEAPGAMPGAAGAGQVTGPRVESFTATEVSVTFPVLVTR